LTSLKINAIFKCLLRLSEATLAKPNARPLKIPQRCSEWLSGAYRRILWYVLSLIGFGLPEMPRKLTLKLKFAMGVLLLKVGTAFTQVFIIPLLAICALVILSSFFYGLIDPLIIWLEYGKWPSRDILYLVAPENCAYAYMRPDGLSMKDWCRPDATQVTGWVGVDRIVNNLMDAINVFVAGLLFSIGALIIYGVLFSKLENCERKYKRISQSRLLSKRFFL
jgi:hypothetical protein